MKKIILCSAFLANILIHNAFAIEHTKSIYSKMNVNIGYSFFKYAGNVKVLLDKANQNANGSATSTIRRDVNIGIGYNVYFKVNNFVNPFVGVDVNTSFNAFRGGREISLAKHTFKSSNGEAPRTDFDRAVLNSIASRPENAKAGHYASSVNKMQWVPSATSYTVISETQYPASYSRPDDIGNFVIRQDRLESSDSQTLSMYTRTGMIAPITDVWETGKISSYTPNIAAYLPQRGEIVYFDSNNDTHNDTQDSVLQSMRMREFFVFNAKLGSKIVFGKYFSLQPYAIVGFNVLQGKFGILNANYTIYSLMNGGEVKLLNNTSSSAKTKINIGLSTGAGIECLIYERLSIGAEYRHTFNQFKIFENSKTKVQTRHMTVKIGYYFL